MNRPEKEVKLLAENASMAVGSYFKNRAPATGLTFDEEKELMPDIINIPFEDRDFRREVLRYFKDISTKIPDGEGLTLEIGRKFDNNMPAVYTKVTKDGEEVVYNQPINVEDYVRYKHALGHPHVTDNIKLLKGNPHIYRFYIEDHEVKENKVKVSFESRKKARNDFYTIDEDLTALEAVLLLSGLNTANIPEREFARKVESLVDNDPDKYLKYREDKLTEQKVIIYKAFDVGAIKKHKNGIYYLAEDNTELGTLEEAAKFLTFKKNVKILESLKAQIK